VTSPFRLEPLGTRDRSGFECGVAALDQYFRTQVTQDARRRVTNCFVTIEAATDRIAAFYTIASASVATGDLPDDVTKRLPRYLTLPAVRIGRLAVDHRFQGSGLGTAMLADAAYRILHAAPAVFTLLVDAKDDQAVAFYEHHGFRRFTSQPRTLFLPMATAEKAWLQSGGGWIAV
jgi:ribosomal protein S18 acetylase RimI-like enzyme